MKAPENLMRDGNNYSIPNRRGRQPSRVSPRSDYRLFWRFTCARTAADFYPAAVALASKLLKRGQDAADIAIDMEFLARRAGFSGFVLPVVADLSLMTRGAA
ncbi:hypothetical protein [Burkholderia sp. HI2500]|uniref:hypothetical protein n=1 Tax=Burkholderia sp. HI2500 TaxID=2015358 RepID=UPI00117E42A0|nr:hypothetical protein [Burkholderia sp. HI2500]